MKLYRYMSFENFIDMIINEKLTLISPNKWKDSYEGWLWKVYDKSDKEKVRNSVQRVMESVFAQCWSKEKDSIAMWSIYSYNNKSIMIEVLREQLEELPNVICRDIIYTEDAHITIDELIQISLSHTKEDLLIPYTKKRNGFSYENEVRIFNVSTSNQKRDVISIPIPNCKKFINDIVVHPFAPEWYVEIVRSVCRKYNLPFSGKSTLYDPIEEINQ